MLCTNAAAHLLEVIFHEKAANRRGGAVSDATFEGIDEPQVVNLRGFDVHIVALNAKSPRRCQRLVCKSELCSASGLSRRY